MWQDILITDLTQMSADRVCIAGITRDLHAVRPNPTGRNITTQHLIHSKFVVRPRTVIQLFLKTRNDTVAPHIEDQHWDIDSGLKFVRLVDDRTWRKVLERTTLNTVEHIFETRFDHNKNVLPDCAKRSLGTLKPISISRVEYLILEQHNQKQAFYMSFVDSSDTRYERIPITDLALRRFIVSEMRSGKSAEVVCANLRQHWNNAEVWLRLGLGRPWEGRCWLQVNGVYTFPDYLDGRCFNHFNLTETDTL